MKPFPIPRNLWRRAARVALWLAAAFLVLTALPVLVLRWVDPPTSAFMMERRVDGVFHPARRVAVDYRWTNWNEINPWLGLAVISAEDQRFLEHNGFDFESIRKALEQNVHRRTPRGASTITQQVAKNLFLWPGRNIGRKAAEAWFTVLIESFWPKQRILEVYVNVAEFGDGVYGAGAASRRYFHKRPMRLTLHDAALLAAVLPSPRRFHVEHPTVYVQRRAWWIERQMSHLGRDHLASFDAGVGSR